MIVFFNVNLIDSASNYKYTPARFPPEVGFTKRKNANSIVIIKMITRIGVCTLNQFSMDFETNLKNILESIQVCK